MTCISADRCFNRAAVIRIAALTALLLLSGCAQYHCSRLEESAACYAAYETRKICKAENRYKIRPAGLSTRVVCKWQEPRCDERGRCREAREVCVPEFTGLYDYREYDLAVAACMSHKGLAAYDDYFSRPLF